MTQVVLGSASTGRLKVLRQAGIDPLVVVSGIDEDRLIADLGPKAPPGDVVCALARAKAEQVAGELEATIAADCVVIGCDSMLYLDGQLCGKPVSADAAVRQWHLMRGRSGQLHTGHCLLRLIDGDVIHSEVQSGCTTVHFGTPSDADLSAYVASGEPLRVAGGFTLDGLGGWFVDGVDGDPANVIGISLPLLRGMLERAGLSVAALWAASSGDGPLHADGRLGFVPLPPDPSPTLTGYAHPERLVTADWLSAHMGSPGLVIVESDEDVLLYDVGHVPGAVKIDWHTDLNDPRVRDYINGEQFAELMDRKGIARDDTVVIYGDKSNWWAAYALWVFTLFGHPDVRLLNGGRDLWLSERRDTTLEVPTRTSSGYPVVARNDAPIRAYKDDVLDILGGQPLIDVRSPDEYTGKRTHMPDYPEEGALRAGHIPTARSIPWGKAVDESARFRSREELEELYGFLQPDDKTVVYCRIGERSSHTWFVLTHLLGKPDVRNYDGSWTEWGNTVRVPIVAGENPGVVPA